jgi:preprotein translocase subunit SecG
VPLLITLICLVLSLPSKTTRVGETMSCPNAETLKLIDKVKNAMIMQTVFTNVLVVFFIFVLLFIVIVEALYKQGANIKLAPDTLFHYANCY